MPEDERTPEALTLLLTGEVELQGRMPWSSNATFLATVRGDGGRQTDAVYKPLRGERPLWDFPSGLFQREVAAYRVAELLGVHRVPVTVSRFDLPLGIGSLQRFQPADFGQHYFTLLEDEANHDALREIAVLDIVINNADRKSGHCLLGDDARIWAIDHGVAFHTDPKLRTVIWDFAGEPLPASVCAGLERVAGGGAAEPLTGLLTAEEVDAVAVRARALARAGRLPDPDPDRRPYPWPLV